MPHQRLGQGFGSGGLRTHAQVDGFQTFQHDPRAERRHRGAGVFQERFDRLANVLFRPQDHTAHGAPLPVNMLGRGINHHIRALFKRTAVDRRGEYVVDHHFGVLRMGQLGHGGNVDHLERRVRHAFKEHHIGFGCNLALPRGQIGAVQQHNLDPVAAQDLFQHVQT